MIAIEDLSFTYNISSTPVLNHLDLTIDAGDFVAIVGPNGCGKSTLLKLIKGLLKPSAGRIVVGNNNHTSQVNVGYLGGNPYDFFVGISVEQEIVFGLENMKLPRREMLVRMTESLEITGLKGMQKRLVHTLSGGEQQRLALAAILAMGTELVLIDDAFSMIDQATRHSIRRLFAELRDAKEITVIEVTDEGQVAMLADQLVFIEDASVRFFGPWKDFARTGRGRKWMSAVTNMTALWSELLHRSHDFNVISDCINKISETWNNYNQQTRI
jgi:energy-coupling factor transport system ATP-binding protein